MASLYRRPKSQYWWAKISTPDGKKKRFSTQQTDFAAAQSLASSVEREIKHQRPGLHSALANLANEYAPAPLPSPREFLQGWLARKKLEVSPATYTRYNSLVLSILPHLNPQLSVLDRATILHVRDQLAADYSPTTVNLALKILRMALSEAVTDGLIASNPAKGVKPLRTEKTTRRPFQPEELARLLAVCPPEWYALTVLGVTTGQRLNDLAEIEWNQLNLETVEHPETKREISRALLSCRMAKTDKHMELPLSMVAVNSLRKLPEPLALNLPVFPDVKRLSRPARSNSFAALLHEARLTTRHPRETTISTGSKRTTQPLSFHSLRHTANTLLKASGASQATAQAILGHDSKAISDLYTHLDADQVRPAVDSVGAQLEALTG